MEEGQEWGRLPSNLCCWVSQLRTRQPAASPPAGGHGRPRTWASGSAYLLTWTPSPIPTVWGAGRTTGTACEAATMDCWTVVQLDSWTLAIRQAKHELVAGLNSADIAFGTSSQRCSYLVLFWFSDLLVFWHIPCRALRAWCQLFQHLHFSVFKKMLNSQLIGFRNFTLQTIWWFSTQIYQSKRKNLGASSFHHIGVKVFLSLREKKIVCRFFQTWAEVLEQVTTVPIPFRSDSAKCTDLNQIKKLFQVLNIFPHFAHSTFF